MDSIIEEIRRGILHACNMGLKRACEQIGRELFQSFEIAIYNFYAAYDPVMYRRTHSLFQGYFGVGGKDKFYKQNDQLSYSAGLYVDGDFIPGEPYEKNPPHGWYMSKWLVFDRAFNEGIHGFLDSEVTIINRSRGDENNWKVKAPPKSRTPRVELDRSFSRVAGSRRVKALASRQIEIALDSILG